MARQELKAKLPLTLFVGLGGTGCDIIRRISEMTNSDQRQFIRFVAFDTDANELRELRHAVSGLFSVQTSQRMTVGQALDTNPVAMNEWFPKNPQLYNKPLTEGAGQIRAISRLAFDSCVREGRISGLHQAIDELQRLNSDDIEQAMRVVIVTTLVGGTGSGILLPVSMYIRNYLETHCGKKHPRRLPASRCLFQGSEQVGAGERGSESQRLRDAARAQRLHHARRCGKRFRSLPPLFLQAPPRGHGHGVRDAG